MGGRVQRYAVVVLWLAAAEIGDEETGLSKGPANPADLGTRCAVLAGREDRAYLHCAEPTPATPKRREPVRLERSYTDQGRSGYPSRPALPPQPGR